MRQSLRRLKTLQRKAAAERVTFPVPWSMEEPVSFKNSREMTMALVMAFKETDAPAAPRT